MNATNIPKPPEQGSMTDHEYLQELQKWAYRVYDALVYMSEIIGGSNNGL